MSTGVKRQRDSRASVPVPGQPTRWRCSSIAKDLRRVLGVSGQRGVLIRAGKRPEGAIVFFVVLFLPRASPVSQSVTPHHPSQLFLGCLLDASWSALFHLWLRILVLGASSSGRGFPLLLSSLAGFTIKSHVYLFICVTLFI